MLALKIPSAQQPTRLSGTRSDAQTSFDITSTSGGKLASGNGCGCAVAVVSVLACGTTAGVHSGVLSSNSASSPTVPPAASQSETSLVWLVSRSGSSSTEIRSALPCSDAATFCACSHPALSLSAITNTFAPRNVSLNSSCHLPAPRGLHVPAAGKLSAASLSTSFSPSVTITGKPCFNPVSNSGKRYKTRRTPCRFQIQPPLPSGWRCLKSFG